MPATQKTVTDAILASAFENSTLLVKLASTEEAPGNLALHLQQLTRLQSDLDEQNAILEKLKSEAEIRFKQHKKYSGSATRKFYYRATGMLPKFEAKAMKGEQEYFAVLTTRSKAEERRLILQNQLSEAEKADSKLQAAAREHGETHERIDELYESLFAGPTPGFVEEDSLENRLYTARGNHETVKVKIIVSRQAIRQLKLAVSNVGKAQKSLGRAELEAANSILFFDEAFYSMAASNHEIDYALAALQRYDNILKPKTMALDNLTRSITRALNAAKTGKNIPSSRDPIASAIATAQSHISNAESHLQSLSQLVKERETDGLDEIKRTARTLEDSRQALHQERMGIFEEVAGFGQAAPSYNECCDRADAFCELPPPPVEEDEEEEGADGAEFAEPVSPVYEGVVGGPHDIDARRSVSPLEDERGIGLPVNTVPVR